MCEQIVDYLSCGMLVISCMYVCMYLYLLVCLLICLSVCLSVCLSAYLPGCLSVCLSGWIAGWLAVVLDTTYCFLEVQLHTVYTSVFILYYMIL